ncbi:hypothetical protein MC885_016828 [Smutsia gigantea]|nr:hypothetical protein MC885_016828 [Smutsia gigantea]
MCSARNSTNPTSVCFLGEEAGTLEINIWLSPKMPSPQSQSPKGAEVEEAGAHRKRWRGLPALRRAATSGRNRNCLHLRSQRQGSSANSPSAFYGWVL